jgi:hypothetical protein
MRAPNVDELWDHGRSELPGKRSDRSVAVETLSQVFAVIVGFAGGHAAPLLAAALISGFPPSHRAGRAGMVRWPYANDRRLPFPARRS